MNEQTTEKIISAFCGSRHRPNGNCPFSPIYNGGISLCFGQKLSEHRFVDAVSKWLKCNELDDKVKHCLVYAGVYDTFMKYFGEVKWV